MIAKTQFMKQVTIFSQL